MAGWDSVEGGILLDLCRMTEFEYDAEAEVVKVGAGLRWEQIYELAEGYGVAPMGGRVGHVGTGLLLGGGLSLLSPRYGYACDGIVSVEVVTVDGKVRHVESGDPLLRAIKGGGGRFGIVTHYSLCAYRTGKDDEKVWYGGTVTSFDPSGMKEMVRLTETFVQAPDDANATMLSNVGLVKHNGSTLRLGTTFLFYKGGKEVFEEVFEGFLKIEGAVVDVKEMSFYEASKVTPLGWRSDQAYKWIGGSLYPDPSPLPPAAVPSSSSEASVYLGLWNNIRSFLTQHESLLHSAFLSITPVRTNQIDQGYLAGGNALSPPRGRSYMHWLFSNILDPGSTAFPEELEKDRLKLIRESPSSKGLPLLLNEVDASQRVFESYGWYEGLKEVYGEVDPSGFSVRYQQGPTF